MEKFALDKGTNINYNDKNYSFGEHYSMRNKLTSLMAVLLSASILVGTMPFVFASSEVKPELNADLFPQNTYLIEKKEYDVAPGVYETQFTANNATATRQNQCYALTIDLNGPATILASYKNQDGNTLGMQSVRDQATTAEAKRNVNVVAAVNADIFNMTTGGTTGALVMDGAAYNHHGNQNLANGRPYFAIMEDGTADIRETNESFDGVKEAVGLWEICVRDGKNVSSQSGSNYEIDGEPRTAIGIKADGSVVILVDDGRQAPISLGFSWPEIADLMISMGCVEAGHLDGGGSTTLLSQHEGSSELVLRNNPCNGAERNVSTALMVVSNQKESGSFDHAAVQSAVDSCTPGAQVQFSVVGADSSGAWAQLPSDGTFSVADSSFGSIDANGLFTSSGKAGSVTIQFGNGDVVYGQRKIDVVSAESSSDTFRGFVRDEATGKMKYQYLGKYLSSQWVTVGTDVYYLDDDGFMVTGTYDVTERVIPGRSAVSDLLFNNQPVTLTYTFDEDGKLIKGAVVNRNGYTYYVYAGVLQFNWHYYDGAWHFFDGRTNDGGIHYGQMLTGNWTRDSQRYICNSKGELTNGFVFEDEGGVKYLWAGMILSGWQDVDGVSWSNQRVKGRYYFDPSNSCYRATDQATISGVTYYFNEDGTLRNGVEETDEGTVLLKDGLRQTGWHEIDGTIFYFDPENNGILVSGSEQIHLVILKICEIVDTFAETLRKINEAFRIVTF